MEALVDILAKAKADGHVAVAHVQGPHGSGKSTAWLNRIWREVREDPNTWLLYLQPTTTHVQQLHSFLVSNKLDGNVIKDELENPIGMSSIGESRVDLMAFDEAAKTSGFRKINEKLGLSKRRWVVCIDVEVVPTAVGEFLLAWLKDRGMKFAAETKGQFVMVSFGTGEHRYPLKDVDADEEDVEVAVIHMGKDQLATTNASIQASPVAGNDLIRAVLHSIGTSKPEAPNMIVTFLDEVARDHMEQRLRIGMVLYGDDNPTTDYAVVQLTMQDMREYSQVVRDLASPKRPTIAHLGNRATIPFCIGGRLSMIITTPERVSTVLLDNGLYAETDSSRSKPEMDSYRGFISKADNVAEDVRLYVQVDEPEDYPQGVPFVEMAEPEAEGKGLLHYALLAISHWPQKNLFYDVPVRQLHPRKWREAVERLLCMGLVEKTDVDYCFKPSPLGRSVLAILQLRAGVDSLPLAHFLARALQKGVTPLQRALMVRMAMIWDVGLFRTFDRNGVESDAIRDALTGPASNMLACGSIWVALSIYIELQGSADGRAMLAAGGAFTLSCGVKVESAGIEAIQARVARFETVLKLEGVIGDDDLYRARLIKKAEVTSIELALVEAWLPYLIWVPKGHPPGLVVESEETKHDWRPKSLVTTEDVDWEAQHACDIINIERMTLERPAMLVARKIQYFPSLDDDEDSESYTVVSDLTLICSAPLSTIRDRVGANSNIEVTMSSWGM